MKKTIFSLLLVVALVAALAVSAIAVEPAKTIDPASHCLCGDPTDTNELNACAKAGHKVEAWQKWDKTDSLPTESGYYYLANDVALDATYTLTGEVTVAIDLNGHTIGANKDKTVNRLVALGTSQTASNADAPKTTLILTDSVGDKDGDGFDDGKLDTTNVTIDSNANYGLGIVMHQANLDIYGGTITSSGRTKHCYTGGENLFINRRAANVVNMYGGAIVGGQAHATGGNGGNVLFRSGTFNMYGGIITGGTANNGGNIAIQYLNDPKAEFNMYGGTISNSSATNQGGAVWMTGANAQFKMNGGIIYAGNVKDNGGGITLATKGCKFTMNGGTIDASGKTAGHGVAIGNNAAEVVINDGLIIGGTSTGSGGAAISSFTSGNKFTMNGGTITGGIHNGSNAVGRGGAVRVSGGTLVMTGGTITGGTNKVGVGGGLLVTGTSSATISGNVVITGNTDKDGNASNLYLDGTNKITFGEGGLGNQAKIGVSMTTPGAFTAANTSAYAANFISDNGKFFVVANADKALELTDKLDGFVAMVGSTPYATVEEAVDAITDNKTQSIKLIASVTQAVEIKKDVYLDLNGKDMDTVTVAEGATLYVFDSQTADYAVNTTNRDYGVIKTINGKVARTFLNADNHKYLVVKTADGYSAHRIYMAVTSSIIDGAKNGGMKYRTVLKCDELVAGLIADYGVTVSNGTASQNVSNFGTGETCTINAWGGSNMNEKVSGVYEILKSGDAGNAAASEIAFGASAYITLNDSFGEDAKTVNSAVKERSMQEMIVKAVANWNNLTAEQQATLKAIYTAFNNGAYMDDKNKWPNVADKLK